MKVRLFYLPQLTSVNKVLSKLCGVHARTGREMSTLKKT